MLIWLRLADEAFCANIITLLTYWWQILLLIFFFHYCHWYYYFIFADRYWWIYSTLLIGHFSHCIEMATAHWYFRCHYAISFRHRLRHFTYYFTLAIIYFHWYIADDIIFSFMIVFIFILILITIDYIFRCHFHFHFRYWLAFAFINSCMPPFSLRCH
jgi:hypothetical protein